MDSDHGRRSQLRGVLFDFEGTLVDFQWRLAAAHAEALETLAKFGLDGEHFGPDPDYAVLFNRTRDHDRCLGDRAPLGPCISLLAEIYDRYDADALTRWRLYPQTRAVLDTLAQAGCRLGVVSSIGRRTLLPALEKLGIAGFFRIVVSRDEVTKIKPHPEGLLKAAQDLALDAEALLYVGDSIKDVDAAHAAGMAACHLDGGEDRQGDAARSAPEYTIATIQELPAIVGV
jgi:HAD superfamily hydrolase (TIGR01509 family)